MWNYMIYSYIYIITSEVRVDPLLGPFGITSGVVKQVFILSLVVPNNDWRGYRQTKHRLSKDWTL